MLYQRRMYKGRGDKWARANLLSCCLLF
jgi:hypothetical protein